VHHQPYFHEIDGTKVSEGDGFQKTQLDIVGSKCGSSLMQVMSLSTDQIESGLSKSSTFASKKAQGWTRNCDQQIQSKHNTMQNNPTRRNKTEHN